MYALRLLGIIIVRIIVSGVYEKLICEVKTHCDLITKNSWREKFSDKYPSFEESSVVQHAYKTVCTAHGLVIMVVLQVFFTSILNFTNNFKKE